MIGALKRARVCDGRYGEGAGCVMGTMKFARACDGRYGESAGMRWAPLVK